MHAGGSWRTLSAAYPSLNAWHHLAATYDGAMMRLYIDGVEAATRVQTGAITVNTNQLAFGNQTGYSEYFGGSGGEFRIWNVARTQAEIQANMNKELDPTIQTGLVSYYTFNHGITGGSNAGLTTVVDQKGSNNGSLTNFNLSGASSNFVTQNSIIVLPLRWLTFTVRQKEENILLNWSTAAEENTKDFVIQHSSTGGREWQNVGIVDAAGNSAGVNHYHFVHNYAGGGVHHYRIQQRDADGSSCYSEIRSIQVNIIAKRFTVLNNGLSNGTVQIRLETPADLSVLSSDGRLLLQKRFNAGVYSINVSAWSKGIYWLKVGDEVEQVVL